MGVNCHLTVTVESPKCHHIAIICKKSLKVPKGD